MEGSADTHRHIWAIDADELVYLFGDMKPEQRQCQRKTRTEVLLRTLQARLWIF